MRFARRATPEATTVFAAFEHWLAESRDASSLDRERLPWTSSVHRRRNFSAMRAGVT